MADVTHEHDGDERTIRAGYRYACALSGDPDSARDLVHDAWLSLIARHGPNPDRALLFRAVRHRHIDAYRRRERSAAVPFDEKDAAVHAAGARAGFEDPTDLADPRLAAALGTLRDIEREALFLAVVEGYTAAEIGQLNGSPRGTVLSHLHRARAKLRSCMGEEESGAVIRLEQRGNGTREGER